MILRDACSSYDSESETSIAFPALVRRRDVGNNVSSDTCSEQYSTIITFSIFMFLSMIILMHSDRVDIISLEICHSLAADNIGVKIQLDI